MLVVSSKDVLWSFPVKSVFRIKQHTQRHKKDIKIPQEVVTSQDVASNPQPTNTSSLSQNQHKLTCSSLSSPPPTVVQPVIPDDFLVSQDAMGLTSSTLPTPPPEGVVGILQDNIGASQESAHFLDHSLLPKPKS